MTTCASSVPDSAAARSSPHVARGIRDAAARPGRFAPHRDPRARRHRRRRLFQGFARAELVTAELAPAIRGADVVIVCTGSHKHAEVARLLAPPSSTDRRSSWYKAGPAARSSSGTS